jgi:Zn/Cd-binding protein ZinT
MTKLKDLLTEASAKDRYNAPPMNKWWTGDKDALMAAIYHAQRQLPPTNKSDYEKNWKSIVQQLQKKFPAPTSVYKAKLNEGSKADRWFDNLKYYYEKGLKSPDLKDSEEKKAYIKLAKNFFGKLKEGKGRGIKEGFITKYNNKADMSVLSKYIQSFMDWCWETKDDALDVAGMYLDQDEPKLAKNWRAFSQSLVIIYKELKNLDAGYAARTKAVLPSALQKKLENAKFHQGPTTEDNYKQVLKQAIMFMKELKKLK